MKFLIIDTSGPDSFAALSTGSIELLPITKQSQTLLPAIQKLLGEESIDFIAVGTGPGSFTGTRIGVMTAKALALSMKLPLLPFCSLKIYLPTEEGPFTLYGDAKSQGHFILQGKKEQGVFSFDPPYIGNINPTPQSLNIPLLSSYLLEKYKEKGGLLHQDVEITYLKNP